MVDNKVKLGVIGLISLLLGFGGSVLLTPIEFQNAYICNATKIGIFYGGISSTGATGYPYQKGNATGSFKCATKWVPLKQYTDMMGIDPYTLIQQSQPKQIIPPQSQSKGKQYICNNEGCVEK